MNNARRHLIEEFEPICVTDLRRAVGGRAKFRQVDHVTVHLLWRDLDVQLARIPSNIGPGGQIVVAVCARCGKNARVLRIAPVPEGLLCARCLRRVFNAKYASQARTKPSTRTAVRRGEGESHAQAHDPQ